MPWYGFIHPLLAVATVWLGLVTAQTSLSKISDWDFPLRRQRGRTIVFFMLCIANFAVGLFVNVALRDIHKGVKITGHVPYPSSCWSPRSSRHWSPLPAADRAKPRRSCAGTPSCRLPRWP
jgi:hypothetical protein